MALPKSINHLSDLLSSLPGVGPKLSNRLALFLAVQGKGLANELSNSLTEVIQNIKQCEICGNISLETVCDICSDTTRDKTKVIVVEDALDLESINSTGEYNGLFHVLGGVISPVNGIGPEDLSIEKLLNRVEELGVTEIIFALNPNIEGDATSLYIKNELENRFPEVKTTRLAKGIPVGGDLEFMSSQTLQDSLKSRVDF